ncbi:MAG TPA: hypothetical protein VKS01_01020 [Bryobacteraceae bacterium]|nr:hypothetical protein [Bryobacteraceae bacterium]
MRFVLVASILFSSALAAQPVREGTPGDALKLVTIQKIVVEGTRLPALSVVHIAQIKVGDQVNFLKLRAALEKVTATGLIKNVDFEYESVADSEQDVIVHLLCVDEQPAATASIEIPDVNEDEAWQWLAREVDPLFTRAMPPNERAIRLYSSWIGKYLESRDPKFQEHSAVSVSVSSSTGDAIPDRVIFKVVKRKGVK